MYEFKRLHYRIEEEVEWSELTALILALGLAALCAIQVIWKVLEWDAVLIIFSMLTFVFVIIYQRCLERVRALIRAVAFADDEEREKLLTLEDEA